MDSVNNSSQTTFPEKSAEDGLGSSRSSWCGRFVSTVKEVIGYLLRCVDSVWNGLKRLYERLISRAPVIIVVEMPADDPPTDFEKSCTKAVNAIIRGNNKDLREAMLDARTGIYTHISTRLAKNHISNEDDICEAYNGWSQQIVKSASGDFLRLQFEDEKTYLSTTRAAVVLNSASIVRGEAQIIYKDLFYLIETLALNLFGQEKTMELQRVMKKRATDKMVISRASQLGREVYQQC